MGDGISNIAGKAKDSLGDLGNAFQDLPGGINSASDAMDGFSESMDKATSASAAFNAQTIISGSLTSPGVFTTTAGGGASFSGIPGVSTAAWLQLLQGFISQNPTPNQTQTALFLRNNQALGAIPSVVRDILSSQAQIDQFRAVRGFADGGVVPGPKGRAQMAVVHGGETITDGGMVYGPWLESGRGGTRFRGYATFRKVGDWLNKQKQRVMNEHIKRGVRLLNGKGG